MTMEEAKTASGEWITELIKGVGFPIVVCMAVMYGGWQYLEAEWDRVEKEREAACARTDRQELFIRDTLILKIDQSTAAMKGIEMEMKAGNDTRRDLCRVMEKINRP